MTYVISDIHGCKTAFFSMLEKISFSESDSLYILGDVCDRGEFGVEILRYIMTQPNMYLLKGNHETFIADAFYTYDKTFIRNGTRACWLYNGGSHTLSALLKLDDDEFRKVVSYVDTLPAYFMLDVNNKKFLLTHAGIVDYYKNNTDISRLVKANIETDDIFWDRDNLYSSFDYDYTLIFGHTPTRNLSDGENKIVYLTDNKIDIDCGCAFGGKLACVCLDTMDVFYTQEKSEN